MAIVALVVVAILLVGGAATAQYAYEEVGDEVELNETFDAGDVGTYVYFDQSNRSGVNYVSEVHVEGSNGDTYTETVDYRWYQDNGSLEVLSDELANSSNNEIEYGYQVPTRVQSQYADYVALIYQNAQYVPLLLFVVLILAVFGVFGGLS